MSAILGRVEFDGRPIDEPLFGKAMGAIAHYGSDGTGISVEGPAAFGHHHLEVARRASPEAQPLRLGALIIVADAILDNRSELTPTLRLTGAEADALPDSALILRAYRKWGEDCLNHLIGDFAFAIFDTSKRSVFLARDHIGARPLYWFRRGATLLFATDIRGLVAFSDLDWQIDEAMVAQYMVNPSRPLPKCFFRGMHFLEPGHHLVVDAEGSKRQRWWGPRRLPDVRHNRSEDYVARFRELTEQAVACRVDTDAPIGSHISGGIDSTAVTVLAAQTLKREDRNLRAAFAWAPAVSARYPDMGPRDERHRIRDLCERHGITCRFGTDDERVELRYLERDLELDGTADLSDEIPVMEKAGADGVRVMLSGWGGDEAFSAHGHGYLAHLLAQGRFFHAFDVARTYAGGLRRPKKLLRSTWTQGIVPMLPDRFFNIFSPFGQMYPNRCFANDDLMRRHEAECARAEKDIRITPDPMEYLGNLILRGHIGARMDTWTAWSASKGILYRYPLTDRRLVEFILGLPPERLFCNGQNRYLAKAALRDKLPPNLSKFDIANETYRARMAQESWSALASQAESGRYDQNCHWLNMTMLKQSLKRVPLLDKKAQTAGFQDVYGAIRIWHMFQRTRP